MKSRVIPSVIAALASLSLTAAAQLNTDLLSYWSLDDVLTDAGPGAADGTFVGTDTTPVYDTGKFGNGIDLDGIDQYVLIPGSQDSHEFRFNPWTIVGGPGGTLELNGGNLTVSTWIRADALTKAWQAVVAKGEGTDWRVARNSSTTKMNYAGGTGGGIGTAGPDVNDPPNLHHVVAVTVYQAETRLYVDGILTAVGGAGNNVGDLDVTEMMIGNNPQQLGRSWNGLIDEVLIWDRALSDGECRGLYNASAGIDGEDVLNDTGAASANTDGDNLPDWWEIAYFGDLTQDDTGDPDSDGLNNLGEFNNHSAPVALPLTDLVLLDPTDTDGDGILDNEEATAGVDGFITDGGTKDTDGDGWTDAEEIDGTLNAFDGSPTDPTSPDSDLDGVYDAGDIDPNDPNSNSDGDFWTDIEELNGTNNPYSDGVLGTAPGDVTNPLLGDTDNDGWLDDEEVDGSTGFVTDPNNADTDGDGVPDGDDIDPTDPNSDSDGDSILDMAETSGTGNAYDGTPTNPLEADSDFDGLDDDEESTPTGTRPVTNPNAADTDGDGIDDLVESNSGNFVPPGDLDSGTDPTNVDTDSDTFVDGAEVHWGFDPTSSASIPSPMVNDLIGYWPFEGSTSDMTQTGADGTIEGTSTGVFYPPTLTNLGQGIFLNRGSEQRVTIKNATVSNDVFDAQGGDISVSAWFQVSGWNQSWQALVSKGDNQDDYRIARYGGTNKIGAVTGNFTGGGGNDLPVGGTDGPDVFGAGDTRPGSYHHVAIVSDADGEGQLWVDGQLVDDTGGVAPFLRDNDWELMIGGNPAQAGDAGGAYRTWNGVIDEVAVWKRTLSPTEILQIWNAGEGQTVEYLINNLDSDGDGLLDAYENGSGTYNSPTDTGTDPNLVDTDGDSVSDFDEVQYAIANGFTPDPNADNDSDGDGIFNLAESTGAENPWVGGVEGTVPPGGESTLALNPDSDGDGQSDGEEVVAGTDLFITDPNNPDTDGDGVSDGDTTGDGFPDDVDPRDPNSDSDFDNLADVDETNGNVNPWVAGVNTGMFPGDPTDPLLEDSDGDGILDSDEIVDTLDPNWVSTDPNLADTDGDGLSDFVETNTGSYFDPTDTGSNPLLVDTDSDTYPDGLEVGLGSDPNLATSIPVVPDIATGLVGYWNMDGNLLETSGFRAAGVHDGVAVGTVPFTDSANAGLGQSADFTGGNVAVRVLNTNASNDAGYMDTYDGYLNTNQQITIAFWAYGTPAPQWNPWMSKRGETGEGYQVRRRSDLEATMTMRGTAGDDDPIGVIEIDTGQPKWLHIVSVWDGVAGTRKMYIDGVEDVLIGSGDTGPYVPASNYSLMFGARHNNANPTTFGNWLNGKVDDMAIWDIALDVTQVAAIYGGGAAGLSVQDLIDLGGGSGDPFASWASASGLDGSPGKEAGFSDDPEGDGVDNGLEWILGGDPLVQDAASLWQAAGDETTGLTLTFTREEDSIGQATLEVEWDTDLDGTWTAAVEVGAMSSVGPNGEIVTVDDAQDPDAIEVILPAGLAVDGKVFARLKATEVP